MSTRAVAALASLGIVTAGALLVGTPPAAMATPSPAPSPSSAPVLLGSAGSQLRPPTAAGLTWSVKRTVAGEPAVATATTDGGSIGLMWLNPDVLNFRFIPGYKVPEKGPVRGIDNKPSTWTDKLVAAFNGGFLLEHNAGGYYYDSKTVVPLRPGLASLVVSTDGTLHVMKWPAGRKPGKDILAVRQNLRPIVDNGKAMAHDGDANGTWGFTDENTVQANRAAVGELADGGIVVAYGADVTAPQLSRGLADAGVQTAMVLDMNKSWPTGFYYDQAKSGRMPQGHKVQPKIWRDPSTYYGRFMRDFIVATSQY